MKIQVKGLVQTPNSVLLYHGPNGLDAPGGDADISDHLLGRSRSGGHVESMTRTFDEIAGKEYDDWKLLISVTNRSHTLLTQYFRRFSRDGAAFVECLAQDDNQPLDWFAITLQGHAHRAREISKTLSTIILLSFNDHFRASRENVLVIESR